MDQLGEYLLPPLDLALASAWIRASLQLTFEGIASICNLDRWVESAWLELLSLSEVPCSNTANPSVPLRRD